MIYDKKPGSLLNYIQRPLNVVTPNGTYIGLSYDSNIPKHILSHVKVKTFAVNDIVFSSISKNAIIENFEPTLEITGDKIGYDYTITDVERRYGYITVASTRIDITQSKITKDAAIFLLEKQLRSIGNVLEQFVKEPLHKVNLMRYFITFIIWELKQLKLAQ